MIHFNFCLFIVYRQHKNGLRSLDCIVESGAFDKPDYKPRPSSKIHF